MRTIVLATCLLLVILAVTAAEIPAIIVLAKSMDKSHKKSSSKRSLWLADTHQTTISKKQIQQSGAWNYQQVLSSLAGVQVHDLYGSGNRLSISIRGFGENATANTLILINGIPYQNPDLAPPDLNIAPVQTIQRIDLIPNSEGVLYGNHAVGGVVNIITQPLTGNHIDASVSYGSYQHQIYNLSFSTQLTPHLTYFFQIDNQANQHYRYHNAGQNENLLTQLHYQSKNNIIRLSGQLYFQHLLYPGALFLSQIKVNRRQAADTTDYSDNHDINLYFSWLHHITNRWNVKTIIWQRNYQARGLLSKLSFSQIRHTLEWQTNLNGHLHYFNLRAGIRLNPTRYSLASSFGLSQDKQLLAAWYALVNIPLNYHFAFITGIRFAELNETLKSIGKVNFGSYSVWVSTLALLWHITSTLTAYLRRAGNFRFPTADEEALTALSQHSLRTQTGVSYALGINWRSHLNWLKLNIYQLNLNNEIFFNPTPTHLQPFGANENLPSTVRRGVIVTVAHQFSSYLSLLGSYSFVDGVFSRGPFRGNRIPFVANNLWRMAANITLTRYWRFYADVIFTGNRYPAGDNANITNRLKAFAIVNLNLIFHYHLLSINIRINNLFNELYDNFVSYNPLIPRNNSGLAFYPAPTRNFLITVGYRL